MEVTEEKKPIEIDIAPTGVWRRILIVLADIFINLISAIFVFELIVLPITKLCIGYNDYLYELNEDYRNRDQILFDNGLLLNETNEATSNIETDLYSTSIYFLEYYASDDQEAIENYEVVYHYFYDILGYDIETVNEIYIEQAGSYLDTTKTTSLGTYALQDYYAQMIKPYFDPADELSEDGEDIFEELIENFFLGTYYRVLADVMENDLTSPNIELSYNAYNTAASEKGSELYVYYEIGTIVSFAVCAIVYFLVIPMCNFKGKTVSEMIMKVDRVQIPKLQYLSRVQRLPVFCMNLVNAASLLVFVPCISLGIGEAFSLSFTVPISIVCMIFLLIELIVMIVHRFNRSLKEIFSSSIVVDSSNIDEFYKAKGYEI